MSATVEIADVQRNKHVPGGGVSRDTGKGKWRAYIKTGSVFKHLGHFVTMEEAAEARSAAVALRPPRTRKSKPRVTSCRVSTATAPHDKRGYVRVPVNGKKVKRSRHVFEQAMGPIPPGFQIHHRNGNKADDRQENLMCVHPEFHRWLHKQLDELSLYGLAELPYELWIESLSAEPHRTNKEVAKLAGDLWLPYWCMKAILNLCGLGPHVSLVMEPTMYRYRWKGRPRT